MLICMGTTGPFSPCYNALNLTYPFFLFFQKYACGSMLARGLMWLFQFAADPNPKRAAPLWDWFTDCGPSAGFAKNQPHLELKVAEDISSSLQMVPVSIYFSFARFSHQMQLVGYLFGNTNPLGGRVNWQCGLPENAVTSYPSSPLQIKLGLGSDGRVDVGGLRG